MRVIIILVLITIALAMLRMLVQDVGKAVGKVWKGKGKAKPGAADAGGPGAGKTGRLVKDPETGAYVDEASAVKATVGGQVFHFESEKSRDAYVRKQKGGGAR